MATGANIAEFEREFGFFPGSPLSKHGVIMGNGMFSTLSEALAPNAGKALVREDTTILPDGRVHTNTLVDRANKMDTSIVFRRIVEPFCTCLGHLSTLIAWNYFAKWLTQIITIYGTQYERSPIHSRQDAGKRTYRQEDQKMERYAKATQVATHVKDHQGPTAIVEERLLQIENYRAISSLFNALVLGKLFESPDVMERFKDTIVDPLKTYQDFFDCQSRGQFGITTAIRDVNKLLTSGSANDTEPIGIAVLSRGDETWYEPFTRANAYLQFRDMIGGGTRSYNDVMRQFDGGSEEIGSMTAGHHMLYRLQAMRNVKICIAECSEPVQRFDRRTSPTLYTQNPVGSFFSGSDEYTPGCRERAILNLVKRGSETRYDIFLSEVLDMRDDNGNHVLSDSFYLPKKLKEGDRDYGYPFSGCDGEVYGYSKLLPKKRWDAYPYCPSNGEGSTRTFEDYFSIVTAIDGNHAYKSKYLNSLVRSIDDKNGTQVHKMDHDYRSSCLLAVIQEILQSAIGNPYLKEDMANNLGRMIEGDWKVTFGPGSGGGGGGGSGGSGGSRGGGISVHDVAIKDLQDMVRRQEAAIKKMQADSAVSEMRDVLADLRDELRKAKKPDEKKELTERIGELEKEIAKIKSGSSRSSPRPEKTRNPPGKQPAPQGPPDASPQDDNESHQGDPFRESDSGESVFSDAQEAGFHHRSSRVDPTTSGLAELQTARNNLDVLGICGELLAHGTVIRCNNATYSTLDQRFKLIMGQMPYATPIFMAMSSLGLSPPIEIMMVRLATHQSNAMALVCGTDQVFETVYSHIGAEIDKEQQGEETKFTNRLYAGTAIKKHDAITIIDRADIDKVMDGLCDRPVVQVTVEPGDDDETTPWGSDFKVNNFTLETSVQGSQLFMPILPCELKSLKRSCAFPFTGTWKLPPTCENPLTYTGAFIDSITERQLGECVKEELTMNRKNKVSYINNVVWMDVFTTGGKNYSSVIGDTNERLCCERLRRRPRDFI